MKVNISGKVQMNISSVVHEASKLHAVATQLLTSRKGGVWHLDERPWRHYSISTDLLKNAQGAYIASIFREGQINIQPFICFLTMQFFHVQPSEHIRTI